MPESLKRIVSRYHSFDIRNMIQLCIHLHHTMRAQHQTECTYVRAQKYIGRLLGEVAFPARMLVYVYSF